MACVHHEAIDHRIVRLEQRMDRLELGIFSMLIALLAGISSLLYSVWDLPSAIRKEVGRSQSFIQSHDLDKNAKLDLE